MADGLFAQQGLEIELVEPMPGPDNVVAVAGGEVDAIADFIDLLPRIRRQAGTEVRAIPLGLELYANGLVVADRLSDDIVRRLRDGVVAALQRQYREPRAGLEAFRRRYPDQDPADALEGWLLAEPRMLCPLGLGAMQPARWIETIAYQAAVHQIPAPPPETVYRPGFLVHG